MKIVFISDTHGKHKSPELPSGDLLIHSGDFSNKISIFGHIHESYDIIEKEGIKFINASSVNMFYRPVNKVKTSCGV